VRVRPPHVGLSRGAVTTIVARAAGRARLGAVRAHRLRHTAASDMLRAGASLGEIGQVLRQRSPGSERLMAQRRASSHTITGYRDTLRLLVGFACAKTGKTPSALDIADLDAPLVAAFLDHLEADRHNTVRTRNWRLAAIHSLFGYAALHHPERAAVIQRVLAIPAKRHERTLLTWLTAPEVDALLAAPDRGTWTGRRDHAMLVLAVQTGLRISELIGLSRGDVVLDAGAHVRCMGKGRKERATPLTGLTVAVLRAWLTENPGQAHDPLFPTRTGTRLSHDAIEHRLAVHLATARASCPSLRTKHATMHTLRHTCAMRLRHAGIDVAVIALWLGHEQMATANIYLHADMEDKERAIARVTPPGTAPGRYQPPDPLLAFLDSL
jgi:site-specific recombinase XerD